MVCLASGLLLFNVTAPNVALPEIAGDLGAGFAEQQWVLSAYALTLAALLLAGGALGDRFGRRRLFLIGLAVFAFGSLACALAPTALVLILSRVLQGMGAAAVFPSGLALIAAEFTGAARARAIGMWGASVAGSIALGPLLGGVLVELSGWRAQFAFAVALVLPAGVVGLRHLRESRDATVVRLDWLGIGLLTGSMSLLVVLVQRANAIGWANPVTIAMAVGAAVLFAGFVAVEFRLRDPLIAPALMRNPTFVGTTVVALVFAAASFAPLVYISLFLLQVAGSGPTLAGLQIAPFALAALVVSLLAARVAARLGVRALLAGGLALCGAGVAMMLLIAPEDAGLRLLPGLVVFGVGAGIVNPTMTVAALSTVSAEHSGMAAGVNNTARQLGIAVGIAALGAVLQAQLVEGVRDGLVERGVPVAAGERAGELAAASDITGAAASLGPASAAFGPVYEGAFVTALQIVFGIAIAVTVFGIVIVLALIRTTAPAVDAPEPRQRSMRLEVADGHHGTCGHLDQGDEPPPSTTRGCEDCLREGSTWAHLRKCLRCGHVGCCDNSPHRHAAAHWHSTGHPLIRSQEPDEHWGWCYPDEVLLVPVGTEPASTGS